MQKRFSLSRPPVPNLYTNLYTATVTTASLFRPQTVVTIFSVNVASLWCHIHAFRMRPSGVTLLVNS
jgi:hypothetical protein